MYAKYWQSVPEDVTTSAGALTRTFTTAAVLATRGTAALVALAVAQSSTHHGYPTPAHSALGYAPLLLP